MSDSIPEVIAHLDDFERDLVAMSLKIREYRHILFAAYAAEGLDTDREGLVD